MTASGFRVTIDVKGLEKPQAALAKLAELGGDLQPFMEDARGILVASVLGRFQSGRGPDGIPWVQTKRQVRRAVGPNGPNKERILVDTGDLQDSIRGEVGPNYVEVGSDGLKNPIKALANQFGSHRPVAVGFFTRTVTSLFGARLAAPLTEYVSSHIRITNLPARPFIGVDEADVANIKTAWADRLKDTYR